MSMRSFVRPVIIAAHSMRSKTRPFLGVAISLVLLCPLSVFANDAMYRCEDGTFTNVAERMCAPYEPKGTVLIMPEGATLASMRALLGEPASKAAPLPDPSSVCTLYKEWQALNLQTGGGVTFANTQDVPRWISLSRIFTAIVAPHCP